MKITETVYSLMRLYYTRAVVLQIIMAHASAQQHSQTWTFSCCCFFLCNCESFASLLRYHSWPKNTLQPIGQGLLTFTHFSFLFIKSFSSACARTGHMLKAIPGKKNSAAALPILYFWGAAICRDKLCRIQSFTNTVNTNTRSIVPCLFIVTEHAAGLIWSFY